MEKQIKRAKERTRRVRRVFITAQNSYRYCRWSLLLLLLLLLLSSFLRIINAHTEGTRAYAMDTGVETRTKEFPRNKLPDYFALAYNSRVSSKAELHYYPFHRQMLLLMMKLRGLRSYFRLPSVFFQARIQMVFSSLRLELVRFLLFNLRMYIFSEPIKPISYFVYYTNAVLKTSKVVLSDTLRKKLLDFSLRTDNDC